MTETVVAPTEKKEPTFTKQQLLESRKYATQRDVIRAVLNNDEEYSFAEVDKKISTFLGKKGKVKK